ncbi:MAG: hypothetical protein NZM04_11185 [Methylacidiphilales bacterium]|nr:hypothetical protein [Candidatus Methylacidiphilales bacterium]
MDLRIITALLIYFVVSAELKSTDKWLYFHPDVTQLFRNHSEERLREVLKSHPYIPMVYGFSRITNEYKNIDEQLIKRVIENKVFDDPQIDIKKLDYATKTVYLIHNIISGNEAAAYHKSLIRDFKNIISLFTLGNYLHDQKHRELVTIKALDYLSNISPEDLYIQEECDGEPKQDGIVGSSALGVLFDYLAWGFNSPVDARWEYFDCGAITALQKKAFIDFCSKFILLESDISKIQVDTVAKNKIAQKCTYLLSNYLSIDKVISPTPMFPCYVNLREEELLRSIRLLNQKLITNEFYRYLKRPDIENDKNLEVNKREFISRLKGYLNTLKYLKESRQLDIESNGNLTRYSKEVEEFLRCKNFAFVWDTYSFGIDIPTILSLSKETAESINQCLYYIKTIMYLHQELESRDSNRSRMN